MRKSNDTMDWDAEIQLFHLKTLTHIAPYCGAQENNRSKKNVELDNAIEEIEESVKKQTKHYKQYSNEQKLLSVCYNRAKLLNAAKSDHLVERTV
ncbi:hypothetical protein G6F56_006786 [Rhizopus delemar]|nr:hypothetical protein G6F56_006786 [Rhizopus delemar]